MGFPPAAKQEFSEQWDMTDLKRHVTTMKQTGYIKSMLAKYGLEDSYPKYTPCTTYQRLLDPVSPFAPMFDNDYAGLVGSGYPRIPETHSP